MVGPRRAPDGRFVPRTGETLLPPKPKQPRDENGHFIPKDKVQSSKPYSRAVREALEAKENSMPDCWDKQNLSEAQALALVHIAMAKSGNVQVGMMLVDRAEGKVPQAAEDREADIAKGAGLKILADLLGIKTATIVPQPQLESGEIQEGDIVPQLPQLPQNTVGCGMAEPANIVPQQEDGELNDSNG